MRRTMNHVRRLRCADVDVSFSRHRAALVADAAAAGARVLHDDGTHFHAERFDVSKSRIVYLAGAQGAPYVNGPHVTRRDGAVEHSTLFLPR